MRGKKQEKDWLTIAYDTLLEITAGVEKIPHLEHGDDYVLARTWGDRTFPSSRYYTVEMNVKVDTLECHAGSISCHLKNDIDDPQEAGIAIGTYVRRTLENRRDFVASIIEQAEDEGLEVYQPSQEEELEKRYGFSWEPQEFHFIRMTIADPEAPLVGEKHPPLAFLFQFGCQEFTIVCSPNAMLVLAACHIRRFLPPFTFRIRGIPFFQAVVEYSAFSPKAFLKALKLSLRGIGFDGFSIDSYNALIDVYIRGLATQLANRMDRAPGWEELAEVAGLKV